MEVLAFAWLASIIITTIVASSKGRSGFGWFLLSIFFGPFALILVALLPSLKRDSVPSGVSVDTHVRCPDCREFVFMDATKCKHCGIKLIPIRPEPAISEPSAAEKFGRSMGAKFSKKQ